jgi:D-serine deaminase-like pyridoxal phosphate-dependent protein
MPIGLLEALRAKGYDAPILTGGSTATYDIASGLRHMSDVQAGTYALMDPTYAMLAPEFEVAAGIVVTVLTSEPRGRIVVNAGAKRLSTDWGNPQLLGYKAKFGYLAEEHGVFESASTAPAVGERLVLLPGHICSTLNLYGRISACRNGILERIIPVDARDPLM